MIPLYNIPTRKPVIGYNEEHGFVMAGKAINIDPEVAWEMWHEGTADFTPDARKQIKKDVEQAGKELREAQV